MMTEQAITVTPEGLLEIPDSLDQTAQLDGFSVFPGTILMGAVSVYFGSHLTAALARDVAQRAHNLEVLRERLDGIMAEGRNTLDADLHHARNHALAAYRGESFLVTIGAGIGVDKLIESFVTRPPDTNAPIVALAAGLSGFAAAYHWFWNSRTLHAFNEANIE